MTTARAVRGITRRDGLIAVALAAPAALLAACTSDDATPGPTASGTASGTPDPAGLADSVAAREAELVARYEAALDALAGADDALLALLAGIRDQHAAHRDALGGTGSTPDAPPQPTAVAAVVAELVAAEREATRERIEACTESADPELARLLALIAASEAAHVPALREAGP